MSKTRPSAAVVSWILYDFGMAWFSMVIITAYFILYFKEVVVGGDKGYGDFLWGIAVSSAMLLSVVLSPLLGAVADMRRSKKRFLIVSAGLSIISTMLLYFTGPNQALSAMLLVVTGYAGYTIAMTFYNAFLPQIAGAGSVEKISGIGWGTGYIGGLAALLCMALMVPSVAAGKSIVLLAGAMYALFALPSFFLLKDSTNGDSMVPASVKDGLLRIRETLREIRKFRTVFLFLLGYFFVSDSISTVIVFFSSYTVDTLHFTVRQNVALLMIIQLTAAAGSVASGLIARRIGALRTVILNVIGWIGSLLGIIAFSSPSAFYVLSGCAGLVLGGTQATARSFIARESPVEKQSEFFGFMTFGSKVAAIFGPFLYGLISQQTNNPRIAILSLEFFFVVGLIILIRIPRNDH
ncbi:MAG TPA: MFS transporter [Syntrophobacteraceae bacterium]|nr:MFS transporter [Syntrophobacteraceae bacterium]